MKIFVVSDTHIPCQAEQIPGKFLEKAKEADLILHAGDMLDISVKEILEKIAPVKAVWGNMDPSDTRDLLKQKEIIKVDKLRIGLMHGWGHPDSLIERLKEEFKNDAVDIIVFGHSHKPANIKIDKTLFFNPGSLCDSQLSGATSYGIIEIDKDKYRAEIVKIKE